MSGRGITAAQAATTHDSGNYPYQLQVAFPFFGGQQQTVWASSDGFLDLSETGALARSVKSAVNQVTTETIARIQRPSSPAFFRLSASP